MQNFYGGKWREGTEKIAVVNPYQGEEIDTVPVAGPEELDQALTTLQSGAKVMQTLTPLDRGKILDKVVELLVEHSCSLADSITRESGKPISEARGEVERAIETFRLSAEEARRLTGRMIPLEGSAAGVGKMGFTLRIPCGIVAAITPFNFPLNLVAHKLGPAIAGGNAVLCKPATATPLTALKLVQLMLKAGVPEEAIACLTGSGKTLGKAICNDKRVRKISFTGSYAVGDEICRQAGMKKVTMELGGVGPVIIMDDADLQKVASAIAVSGYSNAGQTCISTQHILVSRAVQKPFMDALKQEVQGLSVGDPQRPETKVGPMIDTGEAERVEEWIREAVGQGACVELGGKRHNAIYEPTILSNVVPTMKVCQQELFGPAVAVSAFTKLDEAIAVVNRSTSGLACGIYTQDIDRAMAFARTAEYGNININGTTQFRADLMPYGGLKESGLGKEGPAETIREMTEEKMVILHLAQ